MIRECTVSDMEMVRKYLGGEPYGRAVLAAIEKYGFDERFQTVYVDVEGEVCRGVYLWLYRNLLLYSEENKVEVDFLEQMFGIMAPDRVAGRKDNVNIASWLLTDYNMEETQHMPALFDEKNEAVDCFAGLSDSEGSWSVLSRN